MGPNRAETGKKRQFLLWAARTTTRAEKMMFVGLNTGKSFFGFFVFEEKIAKTLDKRRINFHFFQNSLFMKFFSQLSEKTWNLGILCITTSAVFLNIRNL